MSADYALALIHQFEVLNKLLVLVVVTMNVNVLGIILIFKLGNRK